MLLNAHTGCPSIGIGQKNRGGVSSTGASFGVKGYILNARREYQPGICNTGKRKRP